jgi:hypothetical protein
LPVRKAQEVRRRYGENPAMKPLLPGLTEVNDATE